MKVIAIPVLKWCLLAVSACVLTFAAGTLAKDSREPYDPDVASLVLNPSKDKNPVNYDRSSSAGKVRKSTRPCRENDRDCKN